MLRVESTFELKALKAQRDVSLGYDHKRSKFPLYKGELCLGFISLQAHHAFADNEFTAENRFSRIVPVISPQAFQHKFHSLGGHYGYRLSDCSQFHHAEF